MSNAQFSPDGARIITASEDQTARVWEVLPPSAGPPPEWFPDFLRYMAQMRLNPDGELEELKTVDWLALRERLRGVRRAKRQCGHALPAHSPQIRARVASHREVA